MPSRDAVPGEPGEADLDGAVPPASLAPLLDLPLDDPTGAWFGGVRGVAPIGETPVVPLAAPWSTCRALAPRAWVALAPGADRLPLRSLRRVVHRAAYLLRPNGRFTFWLTDPDRIAGEAGEDAWPGRWVPERRAFVRPWRHYHELFRLYPLRLGSPKQPSPTFDAYVVHATRIDPSPRPVSERPIEERYGPTSSYRSLDRLEEPEILDDLLYGVSRLRLEPGSRVLTLGVNDAHEWSIFERPSTSELELWGIDHSADAIAAARRRHPQHASRLLHASIDDLESLALPAFDAVLALNTLHVTTIDRDRVLSALTRINSRRTRYLVSIPNCHFGANEILRRPLDRKDPRHDRSVALKDLRYLSRFFYRAGQPYLETFGTYDHFLFVAGTGRNP